MAEPDASFQILGTPSDTRFVDLLRGLSFSALLCPELLRKPPLNGCLGVCLCDDSKVLHIRLQRAKQYNPLSLVQVQYLFHLFCKLRNVAEGVCNGVMVEGEGEKSFCAGGDIKELLLNIDVPGFVDTYFAFQYGCFYATTMIPQPYISIWEGLVLGGGVGLSLYGSHRIATDSTEFGMPETAIGLHPDVGAVRFLNQLPGLVGLYLGLTGTRLNAADVLHFGLATHYVPLGKLSLVKKFLLTGNADGDESLFVDSDDSLMPSRDDNPSNPINGRLRRLRRWIPPNPPRLNEQTCKSIMHYFHDVLSFSSVMERLKVGADEGDGFAVQTYKLLLTRCPLSCGIWFYRCKHPPESALTTRDVLQQDFVLSRSLCCNDVYENFRLGVKGVLIDKNAKPNWCPKHCDAALNECTLKHVDWNDNCEFVDIVGLSFYSIKT